MCNVNGVKPAFQNGWQHVRHKGYGEWWSYQWEWWSYQWAMPVYCTLKVATTKE